MRSAVLDVGSNSAHLCVADLVAGSPPVPVVTVKNPVRLADATNRKGTIRPAGVERVVRAVRESVAAMNAYGAEEIFAFATAAVRDAVNREGIVAEVRSATGLELAFMDGRQEAELTFRAARGWFGWSAGPLLLADIGGGSVEIAYGTGQLPEAAVSVPLGAARLTRHHLTDGQAGGKVRRELSEHVRAVLTEATPKIRGRRAERAVATSRMFWQLARLCGAPKRKAGPYMVRGLDREVLGDWIPKLAALTPTERAELPGIKISRARQCLAGAIVAEAIMEVLDLERLEICPWALREGLLLHRLDTFSPMADHRDPDRVESDGYESTPDAGANVISLTGNARHARQAWGDVPKPRSSPFAAWLPWVKDE